jgi:hypothetical protein
MVAYLGLHHGLLQGAILAALAIIVIAIGLVTGKLWVDRSTSVHIVRDDPGVGRTGGAGVDRSPGSR